jgi:CBS domain-containing protein
VSWIIGDSASLQPAGGVLEFMSRLNFILAGFNLVPAFPLDGGRVLRSILWGAKKDLRWATRIASSAGAAFGWFLIILGVLQIVTTGNFLGGIWLCLIGLFIKGASQMSYRQMMMKKELQGDPVRKFMKPEPIMVSPSTTIEDFVENYYYKYHYKMFPVAEGEHLEGCLTSKSIKDVPRDEWRQHTVSELVHQCSTENTIDPDSDATEALSKMNNTGNSRLMVVKEDRLEGVVTLKDMLEFLSIKMELEQS